MMLPPTDDDSQTASADAADAWNAAKWTADGTSCPGCCFCCCRSVGVGWPRPLPQASSDANCCPVGPQAGALPVVLPAHVYLPVPDELQLQLQERTATQTGAAARLPRRWSWSWPWSWPWSCFRSAARARNDALLIMLVPMDRARSGSCEEEEEAAGGADTRRRATNGPMHRRRRCRLRSCCWCWQQPTTTKTSRRCCCCCRPTSRTNQPRRQEHKHVTSPAGRTGPILEVRRREDRQGDRRNHEVRKMVGPCQRRGAAGVWSPSGRGVKVLLVVLLLAGGDGTTRLCPLNAAAAAAAARHHRDRERSSARTKTTTTFFWRPGRLARQPRPARILQSRHE